jgi:hypothetical protein
VARRLSVAQTTFLNSTHSLLFPHALTQSFCPINKSILGWERLVATVERAPVAK